MNANSNENMTNYKNIEFKLFDRASRIREIYADKRDELNAAELDGILDRIRTRRFSVAVMGEFKRGKSTFINALLGARILPADVTPATATLNRITYGEAPRVSIREYDGAEYEIGFEELADYVTKLTEDGAARAAKIREATVAYPTVICQNHIDILDTPGLNDDAAMTALSLGAASKSDAVILVLSALSPFSDLEAKFAASLAGMPNIENIFFVVSFIDRIEPDERAGFLENLTARIKTRTTGEIEAAGAAPETREKAARILAGMKPMAVSSTEALDGIISGDNKKLKSSGLENLKGELFRFLTSTQGASLVRVSRSAIVRHCENIREINKAAAEKIRARSARSAEAPQLLAAYQADCAADFEKSLAPVSSLAEEIATRINREKNAAAKEMMERLKSGALPPFRPAAFGLAVFIAETNARVKTGLHIEAMEKLRAALTETVRAFDAERRSPLREALDEARETGVGEFRAAPVFDEGFDATALGREPRFFWSVNDGAEIARPPETDRPCLALSRLDAVFSAYANEWAGFINEISGETAALVRAEAENLAPALLASGKETGAARAAKDALALKTIEKEDRKIEEIFDAVNAIPESF